MQLIQETPLKFQISKAVHEKEKKDAKHMHVHKLKY